jgi:hypothetical protein
LLELANVSQACKMMGYSRDSFYRFKELYDKGGELAFQEISRRKPILKTARRSRLRRRRSRWRSAASLVRCVWQRHRLDKQRLKALEAKAAQEVFS